MEDKRIFVGGLTSNINDKDLEKLFSKFGNVKQVDLKSKYDPVQDQTKVFAFIEIKISANNLANCFRSYSNTKWKDCTLNLQVARENILARLKREREAEQTKNKAAESVPPKEVTNGKSEQKPKKASPTFSVLKSLKKKKVSESSSEDDSDDDEPSNPLKVPMFQGLKFHDLKAIAPLTEENVKELSKPEEKKAKSDDDCSDDTDEIIRRKKKEKVENSNYSSVQQKLIKLSGSSVAAFESVASKIQLTKKQPVQPKMIKSSSSSVAASESAASKIQQTKKQPVKLSKHEQSNMQRLESMKMRQNENKSQKFVIKSALSQIDSQASNNKIKFHYGSSDVDVAENIEEDEPVPPKPTTKKNINSLLNDTSDESSDDADDFRIRPQYEGKKGQKLISLQNAFGNDERFKMDEKFIESSSEDSDHEIEKKKDASDDDEGNMEDEKSRNIDILQSVLGQEIKKIPPEKLSKSLFRDMREVRYDPTDPNSSRFEIQVEQPEKVEKKSTAEESQQAPLPEVSSEKFYEVADNLKDRFQKESTENKTSGFSLLSMFDSNNNTSDNQPRNDDSYSYAIIKEDKKSIANEDNNAKKTGNLIKSKNIMKGFFFFQKDDERLSRGTSFFVRTDDINELNKKWETERREFLGLFNAKKKQAKRKLRGKPQRVASGPSKRRRFIK